MKTMSLSTCFFAIAFGTVGQTVTAVDQPAFQPPENNDGFVDLYSVWPGMQRTKDAKTLNIIVPPPHKWGEPLHRDGKESLT